jgi:hypothetical protein
MFEKGVFGKVFEPKREEVAGGDCIMRSFVTRTLHQDHRWGM